MNTPAEPITAARILIVDDELANVQLLEELLGREGFTQLLGTTDSTRVPALLEAFAPDLLLLDLWMPGLDGYALLERCTTLARREGRWTPVIVLTADASRHTRYRALGLGAHDFLTKPLDPVEVVLRVCNLLDSVWLFKQLRTLQPDQAPPERRRLQLTRDPE